MANSLLKAAVYGLAVGDALGVPYEFSHRGSFACSSMVGYGTHNKPAGTWSDDTSMTLATCASYKTLGRIDTQDIRDRFIAWYERGDYTIDGLFDIGNTTQEALINGKGCTGEYSNGNGSLMRIIPLAFMDASTNDVAAVSSITHAHKVSCNTCIEFVDIAKRLVAGETILSAVGKYASLKDKPREEVRSTGFVRDTFEAALWCLLNTDTYQDCVISAVNLGDDTDTTGVVAGSLAGLIYGYDAIPKAWIDALRGKAVIEACLF